MGIEQYQHLEELLQIYLQRLHVLERQAATFGIETPAHISIQISDLRKKIEYLEEQLLVDSTKLSSQLYRNNLQEDVTDVRARITSLRDSDKVSEFLQVKGVYENRSTNKRLQLFVRNNYGYWPQDIALFYDTNKTWTAHCHIGNKSGENVLIVLALVGSNGQALCDYYMKVGKTLNRWISIDVLTSDIAELNRVNVTRK